jgi:hypothetical protein
MNNGCTSSVLDMITFRLRLCILSNNNIRYTITEPATAKKIKVDEEDDVKILPMTNI